MAIDFGNVLGEENTTASTAANAPTDGLIKFTEKYLLDLTKRNPVWKRYW